MSQKSSVPQAISFVSQVLKGDKPGHGSYLPCWLDASESYFILPVTDRP